MRGKSRETRELIATSLDLLEEIRPASVRAVCYKLFTLKLIPDMGRNSTGKISKVLARAREDGEIPWEYIVDGSRQGIQKLQHKNLADYIERVRTQYSKDRWEDQDYCVELWSEKSTVEGVLEPVWNEYGIAFRSLHGFNSASVINNIAEYSRSIPHEFIALYVGDWDPSGMYMSEVDLPGRLERYGGNVKVIRIALVEEDTHGLPSFSAHDKRKDPRHEWFVREYGEECWELDAMDPRDLRERVEVNIAEYIDWDKWERMAQLESLEFDSLQHYLNGYKFSLEINRQP